MRQQNQPIVAHVAAAAEIAASKALTAAAGPAGAVQTAETTARKSAPAATSGPQFSGVMPPMATQGTVMISAHQRRISRSARCPLTLVAVGKKAPKAT